METIATEQTESKRVKVNAFKYVKGLGIWSGNVDGRIGWPIGISDARAILKYPPSYYLPEEIAELAQAVKEYDEDE